MNTAHDLATIEYTRLATETQGRQGTELTRGMTETAERLRTQADVVRGNIDRALSTPSPETPEIAERLDAETQEIRDRAQAALGQMEAPEQAEELEAAADQLEAGAKTLQDAYGEGGAPENAKLDDGVLGQANLDTAGSAKFDARKMVGQDHLIDKDLVAGVVAHEREHELQAQANAPAVNVKTGQIVREDNAFTDDPDVVTATQLHEHGAMIAQAEVAPDSIDDVHETYQATRRKLGAMLDSKRAREYARRGDLIGFAAEVRGAEPALAA